MISYLCKVAEVSRSGYYNYFSLKSQQTRQKRDTEDDSVRDIILKAVASKGVRKVLDKSR